METQQTPNLHDVGSNPTAFATTSGGTVKEALALLVLAVIISFLILGALYLGQTIMVWLLAQVFPTPGWGINPQLWSYFSFWTHIHPEVDTYYYATLPSFN